MAVIVVPHGGKLQEIKWGYYVCNKHSKTWDDRKDMKGTGIHSGFFLYYTPDD